MFAVPELISLCMSVNMIKNSSHMDFLHLPQYFSPIPQFGNMPGTLNNKCSTFDRKT